MPGSRWELDKRQLEYFENVLKSHSRVDRFDTPSRGVYRIERTGTLSSLLVRVVDLYTVGQADVIQAINDVDGLDCFVTLSNYNGYTPQAKEYGREQRVAVFVLPEFMGALWREDYLNYVKTDDGGKAGRRYQRGESA